jgi:thiol-disulfide isomerase/thioredoxin
VSDEIASARHDDARLRGQLRLRRRSGPPKPVATLAVTPLDAYAPLAARIEVGLDQPQTLANVTLQMHAEPYEEELREIDGDLSAWGRRDLTKPALRAAAKEHLRGQRPPELMGARWLNISAPQSTTLLGSFAGKYVLDFWTIWCGPCHGDFPSLKLAQVLYGDRGSSVVAIHDNCVPPALIAEHVKEQKLTFPIAIDLPDGRLVQAYRKLGLIEGYPGYILLSPEGKVLDADSCYPDRPCAASRWSWFVPPLWGGGGRRTRGNGRRKRRERSGAAKRPSLHGQTDGFASPANS